MTIENFSLSQQALAYELASQVEIVASSALVIRSEKGYVVCANLTGTAWQTLLPDPEPSPEPNSPSA